MNNNESEDKITERNESVRSIRVKPRDWEPFVRGLEQGPNMRPNRAINLFIQWYNTGRIVINKATIEVIAPK